MKKTAISVFGVLAGLAILFTTTAFILGDPQPDFRKLSFAFNEQISLADIATEHSEKGTFKSSVKFKHSHFNGQAKEFYGQEIIIADNPQIDRILIGVTSNLISRIEIWNQNKHMATKELGFMDKMTWGAAQTISIAFYDQTNEKYKGKSQVFMRFYSGTGFLGDIGTISFDLTEFGDLSGNKSIGVFAKSIDSNSSGRPEFSDLRVWKNYRSFD
jgi:hypothetical protein